MIWINLNKKITKKRMFAKYPWYDCYDWLINYIYKNIKTVGGVEYEIMSLFKTKQPRIIKTF